MKRLIRASILLLAGLALVVTGCGDGDGNAGPAQLSPEAKPADQLEFGHNTARVGGISPADVAAAATLAIYPPGGDTRPSSWFLVRSDQWRQAALAAQFATNPINAAVLPIEKDYLPTATVDLLARLKVTGYPKTKDLNTIVVGKVSTDVFVDLFERKLDFTALKDKPYKLSEKFVPLHGGGAARFTSNIVVASGEERDYALPAAAWSAYSGDTLVFAGKDSLPEATRRIVAQREKLRLEKPTMYVIGPEKVISDDVMSELAAYGRVERVAGESAIETAVELARYHDKETFFGWGFDRAPASVSLVNAGDWGNAIGAWMFAAKGAQAPLLLTDSSDRLPEAVSDYLGEIRTSQPSQGFVFGDRDSIGSAQFRELDELLEAK